MGEAIITARGGTGGGNSGGGTINIPSPDIVPSWLFDSNTTYTVPKSGIYKIVCVGAGGANGGGAGGAGVLTIHLDKDTNYNIVIGYDASFGSLITATSGSPRYGGTASGNGVIVYNGGFHGNDIAGSVSLFIPGMMSEGGTCFNSNYTGGSGIFGGKGGSRISENNNAKPGRGGGALNTSYPYNAGGGGYGGGGSGNAGFGGDACVLVQLLKED